MSRRHRTAVHEAGHAVLLHHHWQCLPEEHRRRVAPFHTIDVPRGERSGRGQVSGCHNTHYALRPWQNVQINLAGPMAEDGAATSRWVLDSPEEWDISNHEPYGGGADGGSDFEKVRKFLDDNGMPDDVLTIAVRETAAILWGKRRTVHEVARRALKAEYLGFWALVDIWPDLADAKEEHERQVAELWVRNGRLK